MTLQLPSSTVGPDHLVERDSAQVLELLTRRTVTAGDCLLPALFHHCPSLCCLDLPPYQITGGPAVANHQGPAACIEPHKLSACADANIRAADEQLRGIEQQLANPADLPVNNLFVDLSEEQDAAYMGAGFLPQPAAATSSNNMSRARDAAFLPQPAAATSSNNMSRARDAAMHDSGNEAHRVEDSLAHNHTEAASVVDEDALWEQMAAWEQAEAEAEAAALAGTASSDFCCHCSLLQAL